jgi:hypothetical protein
MMVICCGDMTEPINLALEKRGTFAVRHPPAPYLGRNVLAKSGQPWSGALGAGP